MTDDRIRRAQVGDPAAFDELYDVHVERVYALCLRMTADGQLAEELTQDVFVKAWRRIGTFEGAAAFSTWLYRITVNTVLDARRRRERGPAQLSALPKEALSGGGCDTDAGMDPAARLALERAIAALPERARAPRHRRLPLRGSRRPDGCRDRDG